jgi:hypothetical protein
MNESTKIEASAPVAPMPDEAVNETIKEYNKATRLAKLSSILLEKVDFNISPDALRDKPADLQRELNVKTEILHYDGKSGDCIASITWTIGMKKGRKRVAKCVANYVVLYKEIKECADDIVKMFIDHVGKTATYAYFRALYAQLDWSANLGSPPLPVLHFSPSIGNIKKRVEEASSKQDLPTKNEC